MKNRLSLQQFTMSYSENGTTCRLCGLSCEQYINIFSRLESVNMLQYKIKQLLDIAVGPSDNLPHSVCLPCVSKLDSLWCFKNTCNQVQIKLRKLNSNLSVSNNIKTNFIHARNVDKFISDDNDYYNSNIEEDTLMSIASEENVNVECIVEISCNDPTLQRSSTQMNNSTSVCGDVENFEVDCSLIVKDTESCHFSSCEQEQNDEKPTDISHLSATTSSKIALSFEGHYYRMESDKNSDLLCNRIPYLLVESKMGTKHMIYTVSPVLYKFDIDHNYMLNFDVVYLTVETFDLENPKVVRTLIKWGNNVLKGKVSLMPYYISWLDENNKLNLGFKCIICKAIRDTNRQSVMNHIADHLLCICPVCDRFHRCISNTKKHLYQHESVTFDCSTCGEKFCDFEKYIMHKRGHYKFECLSCRFECSDEEKWLKHWEEHRKKICSSDCCFFYESNNKFREHVSKLSCVGGYVCGACGMAYHCEEYLKLHLRVHGLLHGTKTRPTSEASLPESADYQEKVRKNKIDRLKNSNEDIHFDTLKNILDNEIDLKEFQTSSTAPGGKVFTGFMCFKCSGILTTEKKFRIHIENHFMMTCHCKKYMKEIGRLRKHFNLCKFKRRICVHCRNDVWLDTSTEYLEHLSFHQKRRICIYCQQILPTTKTLEKHINSSHNTEETKQWLCEYCNETLVVQISTNFGRSSLETFKFNHFKEKHPDKLE